MTYYNELGVAPLASAEEIPQAYREWAAAAAFVSGLGARTIARGQMPN
jgi:hypothetical protein